MWELACRAKATNSSFRLMVSLVVQGMMTSRRSWFAAKCPPCPRTPVNHVSGPYKKRKSKQNALAPPLGTSLRLGVPVIRQRGLTGRLRSKADQERLASHRGYRLLRQPTKLCRYLCRDGGASADDSLLTHSHRRQASSHICFALPPGYVL